MKNFLLLPIFALLLAGCAGYHVGPVKPSYLKGVNTIAVPSFKNETLVARLEVMLANSVISQMQTDGTFEVGSVNSSDAILEGVVLGLERHPARSLRGNVLATTEFDLDMKVEYVLTDRRTGKVLARRSVTGRTSFFVGGDVQQDQQQALPLAAADAARQIVTYISEGW